VRIAGQPHARRETRPRIHAASTLGGALRQESRGPLEDLHILAQPAVLPPHLRELVALGRGQPIGPGPGIALGLLQPLLDRCLGQIEVRRDPINRPVTAPARSTISGLNTGVNERRGRGFFLPTDFM
jgi:hypothetical protein